MSPFGHLCFQTIPGEASPFFPGILLFRPSNCRVETIGLVVAIWGPIFDRTQMPRNCRVYRSGFPKQGAGAAEEGRSTRTMACEDLSWPLISIPRQLCMIYVQPIFRGLPSLQIQSHAGRENKGTDPQRKGLILANLFAKNGELNHLIQVQYCHWSGPLFSSF